MAVDIAAVLAADPVLSGSSDAVRDRLAGMFSVADLPAGATVFTEGAEGDGLYLVLDGEARVSDGSGVELARFGPGDWVGLVSVVATGTRAGTCVAVTDLRVAHLPRADYQRLATDDPDAAVALEFAVASQLARDYRGVAEQVRTLLGEASRRHAETAREFDVVVIGGGPLGLAYASWVAEQRPGTRVAVVDRRSTPAYKIGESTLGSSIRAFKSLGLSAPALRRLFEGKLGLALWWTGPDSDELAPYVDAGHFDETFQVERRVLETALAAAVRRRGVEILSGTRVLMRDSTLSASGCELVCEGPDGEEVRYRARIVCDASGPASVIPRSLGLYRKKIDTFNTNAYFGYFRRKAVPGLPYWDVAMTRHIMFPQGWVWFIDLQSWEKTSDETLAAVADYLLDHPSGPDESYPTRHEVVERFGCTVEEVTSIGIVPRDDLDDSKGLPVEERFRHYVTKYPGLQRIMDHYELVEHHYEQHRSVSAFQKMAHDSERFAGDGWVAVGDAAFFVNPLFSPGMSYGVGTSFMAAHDTVHALNRGDTRAESFAGYERYARDLYTQLLRENEMYYRGFRHRDAFERTWMFKFAHATTAPPATPGQYSATDPYLTNLLEPRYRALVDTVTTLQREDEDSGTDPQETVERLRSLVDPYIDWVASRPAHRRVRPERFFAHYDESFRRVEDKSDREVLFPTWRCPRCGAFVEDQVRRCFVCGEPRPAAPQPGHLAGR